MEVIDVLHAIMEIGSWAVIVLLLILLVGMLAGMLAIVVLEGVRLWKS